MTEVAGGEVQVSEPQQVLRDILAKERVASNDDLRTSEQAYNTAYFNGSTDKDEIGDREDRRSRIYRITEVMKWLYPDSAPRSLLETFSVGDISAALALPHTEVTSFDIDPNIFLNVPNNTLPSEVFEKFGKEKTRVGYGGDNWFRSKQKKLTFVESLVPNWHKKSGDAYQLPFVDESYDAVLIQDKSYVFDTIPEAARVLASGGYIVIMLPEQLREGDYISAYKSKKTNDQIDSNTFLSEDHLKEIGLERVEIPENFKEWEELVRWKSPSSKDKQKEVDCSSGYVLEVFRKAS